LKQYRQGVTGKAILARRYWQGVIIRALLVANQRRIAIFIKNGNAKIGCLARF
jgi:hypothetical protein